MWEMTVDMEPGQIAVFPPVSQIQSVLPLNLYEACTKTCHMKPRLTLSLYTRVKRHALENHVEYVYTYVSVSHVLV